MNEIEIYRFEDKRGSGLYTSMDHSLPMEFYETETCPPPRFDGLLVRELSRKQMGEVGTYCHQYGFASKEQIERWIPRAEHREYVSKRFLLKVYAVPEKRCAIGDTQVVFDCTEGRYIKTIDFN